MNNHGPENLSFTNQEWFGMMATGQSEMAKETTDPVEAENLRVGALNAALRQITEIVRDNMQMVHADVELPPVEDGESSSDYAERVRAFIRQRQEPSA